MKNAVYRRVLISFCITFASLLVIQAGALAMVHFYSEKKLEKKMLELDRAAFLSISEMIDIRVRELNSIALQIASDTRVMAFGYVENPFSDKDIVKAVEIMKSLYDYTQSNSFLRDFYIVYKDNDTVVAPKAVYRLGEFYPEVIRCEGLDAAQWKEWVFARETFGSFLVADTYVRGKLETSLITRRALGFPGSGYAVLEMRLNTGQLAEYLGRVSSDAKSYAYILDENGHLIITTGGENPTPYEKDGSVRRHMDGQGMLITAYTAKNGWRYTAVRPQETVIGELFLSRTIVLGGLAVSLSVSLAIAYWVSRKKALRAVGQLPMLQLGFFNRMIYGGFFTVQEALESAKEAGVFTGGASYLAAVLEPENLQAQIKPAVQAMVRAYEIPLGMDRKAIFIVSDGALPREIFERVPPNALLCAGRVYEDILGLSHSYLEAADAFLRFKGLAEGIFYYTEPDGGTGEKYLYGAEVESHILSLVAGGDTARLADFMDTFGQKLKKTALTDSAMVKVVLYAMLGTALKAQETGQAKLPHDLLERLNDDAISFEAIAECLAALCAQSAMNRNAHPRPMIERMREYIAQTYADPSLSLESVAERFGVSPSYISKGFRTVCQSSFYTLLEEARMNAAARLLQESELPIKDIISQTGYTSQNTFGKAFKRRYGVTPTEYRNR